MRIATEAGGVASGGEGVESAFTADQRDMILTRMVDAVASFGTSGLVAGDDDSASAPKMTVDNIMRTFVTPTKSP